MKVLLEAQTRNPIGDETHCSYISGLGPNDETFWALTEMEYVDQKKGIPSLLEEIDCLCIPVRQVLTHFLPDQLPIYCLRNHATKRSIHACKLEVSSRNMKLN
jgi:hypothetical protein